MRTSDSDNVKRNTSSQTFSEADSLVPCSCQNRHFQNLRMPILRQAEIHARHTLRKEARDVVRQIPVGEQVQNVPKMPFLGHAASDQPVVSIRLGGTLVLQPKLDRSIRARDLNHGVIVFGIPESGELVLGTDLRGGDPSLLSS